MASRRNSNNNSGGNRPLVVYGIWKKDPDSQGEKGFWTAIGRAFKNQDGSLNILLDYVPTDMRTTRLHIREKQERRDNDGVDATEGFSDE